MGKPLLPLLLRIIHQLQRSFSRVTGRVVKIGVLSRLLLASLLPAAAAKYVLVVVEVVVVESVKICLHVSSKRMYSAIPSICATAYIQDVWLNIAVTRSGALLRQYCETTCGIDRRWRNVP